MSPLMLLFAALAVFALGVMGLILTLGLRNPGGTPDAHGAENPLPGEQAFRHGPFANLLWNLTPLIILIILALPAIRLFLASQK